MPPSISPKTGSGHRKTGDGSRPHLAVVEAPHFDLAGSAIVVAAFAVGKVEPDEVTLGRLPAPWRESLPLFRERGPEDGLKAWGKALKTRMKGDRAGADAMLVELGGRIADIQAGRLDPTAAPPEPEPTDDDLGIIDLSMVEARDVGWLWQDRIPLGKITLIAGLGGLGKTFLTLDIASSVSLGRPFPDRLDAESLAHDKPKSADVLFLTAEDDLADTIVPRLKKMGADLKRVKALNTAKLPGGKFEAFSLRDIPRLVQILRKYPSIRMIVIDPVTAFLGRGVDDHKNAELRELLRPLADLAAEYSVAVVCITHLNKSASTNFTDKIAGSIAYNNVARVTLAVMIDPDNDDRRLLMVAKNNLSPIRTALAYTIEDGQIIWERDTIEVRPEDLMGKQVKSSENAKHEAITAIRSCFIDNPTPTFDEMVAFCKARNVSKGKVQKFKGEAGVYPDRAGFGPGSKVVCKLRPVGVPF